MVVVKQNLDKCFVIISAKAESVSCDYNNSPPTMSLVTLVFKRRIRHGQKNRKNRFLKKKNRIFYVIKGDNIVYTIPIEVP